MNSKEEIELFNAAKEYAFIIIEKLRCKPFHQKMMERKYEKSLEKISAACLDYAISVKSPPYDK